MLPWSRKMFPGTNLQDLNLDWILRKVAALRGGRAGQYLYKKSDKDFDFGWKTGGGGGGGTSDYLDLDNKPSINNVELVGNNTAADLGLAASSDIPEVPVQSVNGKTGAVVLSASDVGAYVKPESGIPKTDLSSTVQTSLNKADTALQAVPPTYRTATAQDTIDAAQDVEIETRAQADEVGIVITGKRPSMAVTAGQFVIVRNSTISGISDGLYTASAALSPSTDVTAADLTAVSGGGLNSLKSQIETVSISPTPIAKLVSSGTIDNRVCVKKGNVVNAGGRIYGITDNDGVQRAYFQIPEGFRPSNAAKVMGVVKILTSTNPVFPTTPIFVPTIVSIETNGEVVFGGGQFNNCMIDQVIFTGTYCV